MSPSNSKPSVALLDDYLDIAGPHFEQLKPHLSRLGFFPETISATTNPDALIERLKPYNAILSMRERTAFPRSILSELPNLKFLQTTGTRNASIDIQACEDLGIILAGTTGTIKPRIKAEGYDNVTEHCFALILALAKGIPREDNITKEVPTSWQTRSNISLAGKTLGLLGLGKLGANTARTAVLGFGMKILAWSENLTQEKADQQAQSKGLPKGTFLVAPTKADLFRHSDILSIHIVLSPRTRHIVSSPDLSLMKPTSLLINTSRGPLINETDLLTHLSAGRIRGAALDVFDTEPLPADSPWRTTKWGTESRSELIISPHMGYVEEQILDVWYDEQAANLERWLTGEDVLEKITSKNTGYGK
ncbi:putative d-isomer specific 2-hydroxyacid dehydrogenase family protein [Phaeomoniella chlamydospora]|uniref:Putative d-isomer specific 2-hydroxyacid dehydrogenase family protein n=1 Tax=Phaeomoniella chlamydospora TaxID=158046 RepID=A0A0G2H1T9_PHACM|nr:putative d-isomer specific 2-hydroxyacid dehydrogenase family protein [Phaeomoniella chlamydospora]